MVMVVVVVWLSRRAKTGKYDHWAKITCLGFKKRPDHENCHTGLS